MESSGPCAEFGPNSASMPSHLFLKLETHYGPVPGGSLNFDYRDWFEIESCQLVQHRIANAQSIGQSQPPRPRAEVIEVRVTRNMDRAGDRLFGLAAAGDLITLAVVVRVGDGDKDPGQWWSFHHAFVEGFTRSAGLESFSLPCVSMAYGEGAYVRLSAVPKAVAAIVHGAVATLRKFAGKK